MNPNYDFNGQVALVTGALRAAADELAAAGHRTHGATCDVADEDQVAALVDRTAAEFGRLGMAFNNAGIMPPQTDAADEPAEQRRPAERTAEGTTRSPPPSCGCAARARALSWASRFPSTAGCPSSR